MCATGHWEKPQWWSCRRIYFYIYIYIKGDIHTYTHSHSNVYIRVYTERKRKLTADFNRLHVARHRPLPASFADPSPPTQTARNALPDDGRLYGLPRTVQVWYPFVAESPSVPSTRHRVYIYGTTNRRSTLYHYKKDTGAVETSHRGRIIVSFPPHPHFPSQLPTHTHIHLTTIPNYDHRK